MNLYTKFRTKFAGILAVLLLSNAITFGSPEMEKALTLLETAKKQIQSTAVPKPDPLPTITLAKASVKKAPADGRYRGHRAKALEELDNAVLELKDGDKNHKAIEFIDKSIIQIHAGGGKSK